MPKFTCLEPIEHDLQRYEVEGEITLTDEEAAPLLAIGHIVRRAGAAVAEAVTAPDSPVQRAPRAGGKAAAGKGS